MRVRLSQSKCGFRIIASAVLLFAIAGCGNSSIIGKWGMAGSKATVWEFSSNGGVLVEDVHGRYKFGEQDRIKIETPFSTTLYQMKLSGGRMTLEEPGRPKLEFTKISEMMR